MSLKNSFTFDEYREILLTFKRANYKFVTFSQFNESEKYQVIVRHDTDFLPTLNFAIVEKELNISAVYHFMITSTYNIFDKEVNYLIKTLIEMGHRIGYHHDNLGIVNLHQGVLRAFLGGDLESYSLHRPPKHGDQELEFVDVPFAYSKKFYENSTYISDSNCKWKFGHPFDVVPEADGANFQMLTHPIWWSDTNEISNYVRKDYDEYRAAAIGRIIKNKTKETTSYVLNHISNNENIKKILKV
jgi:hypothetical protein